MPSIVPKRQNSASVHTHPEPIERIVLTGFMGSGKSTIGRSLAERIGWRFIDLDTFIEQREGRSVAQIFAESGEAAFRAKETDALLSTMCESRIVVALGGGALETPANRHSLGAASRVCVVLLAADFEVLYKRCQQQIAAAAGSSLPVRPLLGARDAAAARLARREAAYRQCAHYILDTTRQQPEESMAALLGILTGLL